MSDKYTDDFNEWLNNINKIKSDEIVDRDLLNVDKSDSKEDMPSNYTLLDETENISFSGEEKKESGSFEERKKINLVNSTESFNNEDEKIYADKEYVDRKIKESKPKYGLVKAASLILVGSILGSFVGPYTTNMLAPKANKAIVANENEKGQAININTKHEYNIENAVAKKSIPSVVGINVKYKGERSIFGETMGGEGIGSGVIVSSNGYILTNSHVLIDNATEVNVIFSDNSHEKAKIVWKDPMLDLAVIKVEKTGLKPIEFASSDEVEIGDKAIAIGNPIGLNLQSTLTSGYISGKNRSITMQNGMIMNGLIQTDASINSGNSGGALLNQEGKLIGINTAKAGMTDGIGFAIPSNLAKSIVDKIIEKGSFSPVLIGIKGIDLVNYKQYTSNYDLGADEGVYIAEVVKNSTADKAGFREGDILVAIGDQKIESMNSLKQTLLKFEAGNKSKAKLIRDGKEITVDISFRAEEGNI